MTQAVTLRGTNILVKIGDGASPETFTHNCSINGARSFQLQTQTNDVAVPDCDDPNLMAWIESEKVSLSATVAGAGVTNVGDVPFFYAYAVSPDPRNCRIVINAGSGVNGNGYFAGAFLCTDFQVNGDRGQKSNVSIALKSTGIVAWVPVA